jgi:phospholipid transport system transporter-binding protein
MARQKPRADAAVAPATLAAVSPGRFALAGDLRFENAARVLAEGDAAFGSLADAEIDLAGVARVDSAALALLLEWSASAREAGRSLRYRNVPEAIAALAGISEVSELIGPDGGSSAPPDASG